MLASSSGPRADAWNEAFDPDYEPEIDHAAELARLAHERVRRQMRASSARQDF